jgi:hypothetical protein
MTAATNGAVSLITFYTRETTIHDTATQPLSSHSSPGTISPETARLQSIVTIQTTLEPPPDAATSTAHHIPRNANIRQLKRFYNLISKPICPHYLLTGRQSPTENRTTATGCNSISPTTPGNQAYHPPHNSKPAGRAALAIDDTGCNSALPLHRHSPYTYSRSYATLVSPCYLL